MENKQMHQNTPDMPKKNVVLFLFDGFSDWEIAYLTPEIYSSDKARITTFSKNGQTVTSAGGLKVLPDTSLDQLSTEETDLLILPGGEAWNERQLEYISPLVADVHKHGKPLGAICAATTFLGRKGYLDHLSHTSNALFYLKAIAPEYRGEAHYLETGSVCDRNIVTANGTAPVDFARDVFRLIGLYPEEELQKWYQLFKHGIWNP